MSDFSKLKPALVLRRMPRNGVNSSEEINDFIEQSIHDVAGIYNFVNQVVIPAFNGLGKTGTWTDIDPIADGIDGTTIMVDHNYTDTSSSYFYDSGKSRPKTIFESLTTVIASLDQAFIGINEVKARLGTTDEDTTTPTSQATLSEIETKVNFLNSLVTQIRNANAGYLNAGQIASGIVDGTINPSTFHIVNADIDGDVGIAPTKISGIDLTQAFTYSTGVPATYDTKDTILRIKEWIEDITGENFVQFSGTNVTSSSTTSGHIAGVGTGAVTATNVHGLDIVNLSDAGNLLTPPQLLASLDVAPSGVVPAYAGGYAYIPNAVTATKVSLTVGLPQGAGLGLVIHLRRAGANSVLYSGLSVGPAPIPGFTSATISTSLLADDLIYVDEVIGTGHNAKVQVFGHI